MTFPDRVYYEEKRCILRRKKMTLMLNEEKGRNNVSVVFDSIVRGYGYYTPECGPGS